MATLALRTRKPYRGRVPGAGFFTASALRRALALLAVMLLALASSGCMMFSLRGQLAQMSTACSIAGTLADDGGAAGPYVVALLHDDAAASDAAQPAWRQVDYFVMEREGAWGFIVGPGNYGLAAFRDSNGNFRHDAGEPLLTFDPGSSMSCSAGKVFADIALRVPAEATPGAATAIGLPTLGQLRPRPAVDRPAVSGGQLLSFGDVTTLEDARFDPEIAAASSWRPLDFILAGRSGLYLLEPYDPDKIPVVFVHGINGSPRDFSALVGQLDRKRFQPWVFSYASGLGLDTTVDILTSTMLELELHYQVKRFHLVAHSMGGLVARGFLLRRAERNAPAEVPLFISLSTPWGGHEAALRGITSSPVVVPVWRDIVPGSSYLRELFYTGQEAGAQVQFLPAGTRHHLLFTYGGGNTLGRANDGVVTVASELAAEAQTQAERIYGFDDSHAGILSNLEAMKTVNLLLAGDGAPLR
ncbi:alpha/beta hydrolase [Azoarcus indigens]|uniref:Putative serine esterase DUF676 n=1 Tax=Azoarcus indigens TaxID=29545 RepID=A0A4R6EHG7_9RHOO|nr:alpha/beta fold hydrolase [Azoarcus indigens]NMG66678.1 alpha/beta hydrolase [Azoarcus indigens]TDN56867.1 putative serine esterase DUF676 [Azoarcus indigens]